MVGLSALGVEAEAEGHGVVTKVMTSSMLPNADDTSFYSLAAIQPYSF